MKKLLSLLSVLTIGTLTTTNVVACSNTSHLKPVDQSNLPFLYHEAKELNLGNVKKDANAILTAFLKLNPNIKDKTLKVTNITNKTAVINVDKYDTNFKKGTLNVTFNTIESNDLSKLVTIKNIYASRGIKNPVGDIPAVTDQAVVDGINATNGLALTTSDVSITYQGHHNSSWTINTDNSSLQAIVKAKSNKYQGTITVYLNTNIDLKEYCSNTDIGTIFLTQKQIDKFNVDDYKLGIEAFILELVGDANPIIFTQFKDVIANIQMCQSKSALTFNKTNLTLDATDPNSNPLSEYFTNKVTFNYKIEVDKRLSITDAIKNTDLKNLKDHSIESIKQAIIDQNQATLNKYSNEELNRYLVVTLPDPNNSASATVSWLAGSKQFLGHDPYALIAITDDVRAELPLNDTNVYFGIISSDFKIKDQESGKEIFSNLETYLKNKYQLSTSDIANNIADFKILYGEQDISKSDTKVDISQGIPITIAITLKKSVDPKYQADLKKFIDQGFIAGNTYESNTSVTTK